MAVLLLSEKLIAEIKKLAELGVNQLTIAGAIRVNPRTLRGWLHDGKQASSGLYRKLYEEYTEAKAQAIIRNVEIIQTNAQAENDPHVAAMALDTIRAQDEAQHRRKLAKLELDEARLKQRHNRLLRNRLRAEIKSIDLANREKELKLALLEKSNVDPRTLDAFLNALGLSTSERPVVHANPATAVVSPNGSPKPHTKE